MNVVTFADLVAHAASRGYSRSYVEEQLDQGWLPRSDRVGSDGGGSHQVYPTSILRAFDVLVDAKETERLRGNGLRFWLWLYEAIPWDETVRDAVRAVTGATVTFAMKQQLPKLVAFNPGGRPRKDGREPGVEDHDLVSYHKRIDERRASNLERLMDDVGYRLMDALEPHVWRLVGAPINPAVNRKAAKLYVANAAGVPPQFLKGDLAFSQDEERAFDDPNALSRIKHGEPRSWNVDKLLAAATPEEWEETRRCFFLPAGQLFVSVIEAIVEWSPPSKSLQRQHGFFRHPRLAIRALAVGVDVCDKVRRRQLATKQAQKQGKGGRRSPAR